MRPSFRSRAQPGALESPRGTGARPLLAELRGRQWLKQGGWGGTSPLWLHL